METSAINIETFRRDLDGDKRNLEAFKRDFDDHSRLLETSATNIDGSVAGECPEKCVNVF